MCEREGESWERWVPEKEKQADKELMHRLCSKTNKPSLYCNKPYLVLNWIFPRCRQHLGNGTWIRIRVPLGRPQAELGPGSAFRLGGVRATRGVQQRSLSEVSPTPRKRNLDPDPRSLW